MTLFHDEMVGKNPVLESIEGGVLEHVKECVKGGGLLYPTSLPNHLATFMSAHYQSSFIDHNRFMNILKNNVSLIFMPSNHISMNINHHLSLYILLMREISWHMKLHPHN